MTKICNCAPKEGKTVENIPSGAEDASWDAWIPYQCIWGLVPAPFPIPASGVHPKKHQVIAQVLESLSPTWVTWIELWAPDLSSTWTKLSKATGKWINSWHFLCHPLPLQLSLAFFTSCSLQNFWRNDGQSVSKSSENYKPAATGSLWNHDSVTWLERTGHTASRILKAGPRDQGRTLGNGWQVQDQGLMPE